MRQSGHLREWGGIRGRRSRCEERSGDGGMGRWWNKRRMSVWACDETGSDGQKPDKSDKTRQAVGRGQDGYQDVLAWSWVLGLAGVSPAKKTTKASLVSVQRGVLRAEPGGPPACSAVLCSGQGCWGGRGVWADDGVSRQGRGSANVRRTKSSGYLSLCLSLCWCWCWCWSWAAGFSGLSGCNG